MLTKKQEAAHLAHFEDLLESICTSDGTGLFFRPLKLKVQFDRYDINFLDICYAIEHRHNIKYRRENGLRFEVEGPTIDDKNLVITLKVQREVELKILNVWMK